MDDISAKTWNKADVTAININENDDVIDKENTELKK